MTQSFAGPPPAGYCARCRRGYAIGPHVCADLEAKIRADERAKSILVLELAARTYVDRWTPIVGEEHAKACAFDLLAEVQRLRQPNDSSAESTK